MTLPPPKFFLYVVKVLTKKMTRQMSTPEEKTENIFFLRWLSKKSWTKYVLRLLKDSSRAVLGLLVDLNLPCVNLSTIENPSKMVKNC